MTNESKRDEWETRSARENLAILGWARTRTYKSPVSTGPAELPAEAHDSREDDPVARALSNWLWLSGITVMTAKELFKLRDKKKNEQDLRSVGWPADPREMQESLEHVVPFLQGKNPDCGLYPVARDRFMHFEYWEKPGTANGLWVLIPAYEGGPSEEEVEQCVWWEVKYLEGLETFPNPFRDV